MATIALTSWERLKVLYGGSPPVTTDQKQGQAELVINAVSRQVARYLDAEFQEAARVEVYDVTPGQRRFNLRAFPVDTGSTFSVLNDTARNFTGSAIDDDNYTYDDDKGILVFDDEYDLIPGNRVLQVTYTGGIASTSAVFLADDDLTLEYADLILATEVQTLHVMTRAPHFGATSVGVAGGSRSFESPVVLLPQVKELLEAYYRGGR